MQWSDFFGYMAAAITTLCWLPQAIYIIRTKETAGVSALSYGGFALGIMCWLVYGIMIESWPIIAANTVTLLLALIILGLKFHHSPR
jgi:MtN3 and saliva related transmembrane protein